MDEATASPLQAQLRLLLDRRKQQSRLRSLKASPAGSVDFSSNDFLSLSTSPSLKSKFLYELNQIPRLGSTGSRLLDGNSAYAEELEREIAHFHNAPAGLLVNSGFDANVGIFSCLPQPGDVVIYDELIHASVHDGIKASRAASTLSFAHNSVSDLAIVLGELMRKSSGRRPFNVFVAVESVYSMDGDLSPLREIVELLEQRFPNRNAHLIVDEAHATALYGEKGRGRVCELGLEQKVFVRLNTFGKALACNGGKHILRRTISRANSSSYNPVHAAHPPIPDQLCPATNIHHFHVISSTCWDQSSV
jgi:8-amino-7-oxononanoate synthase